MSFTRSGLLTGGATRDGIVVPGAPAGQNEVGVHIHFVAPRHPETMGIPILAGRDLAAADRENSPRVAMVNQTLARLLPGGGAAVGQRIRLAGPERKTSRSSASSATRDLRACAIPRRRRCTCRTASIVSIE